MSERVLLTGATGFVGSRLLPKLEQAGLHVICASRKPERARQRLGERELRQLDVLDEASAARALAGCDVAYYLVHGMRGADDYQEVEARAARHFASAAADAGVGRIVYLGGVMPEGQPSRHLASRLRTGEILRAGSVPTLELRAAMIVGGGSEGWRIVRDLAARLPFMLFPRWLDSLSEPVAIDDVTQALAHAARVELSSSRALDLPGPEALSGREVILRTSHLLGIHPRALRVPVVTPQLSAYWLRLVTRADPRVAAELVEGLRHDLLSRGESYWPLMPEHRAIPFDQAARAALDEEQATLSARVQKTEALMRKLFPSWVCVQR